MSFDIEEVGHKAGNLIKKKPLLIAGAVGAVALGVYLMGNKGQGYDNVYPVAADPVQEGGGGGGGGDIDALMQALDEALAGMQAQNLDVAQALSEKMHSYQEQSRRDLRESSTALMDMMDERISGVATKEMLKPPIEYKIEPVKMNNLGQAQINTDMSLFKMVDIPKTTSGLKRVGTSPEPGKTIKREYENPAAAGPNNPAVNNVIVVDNKTGAIDYSYDRGTGQKVDWSKVQV